MSLPEERMKAVHEVFTKGWQFIKELLQTYPEFPQKPLTEEQWEAIIQKATNKCEEFDKIHKDEALLVLFRRLCLACSDYMEKEGQLYENKKD